MHGELHLRQIARADAMGEWSMTIRCTGLEGSADRSSTRKAEIMRLALALRGGGEGQPRHAPRRGAARIASAKPRERPSQKNRRPEEDVRRR